MGMRRARWPGFAPPAASGTAVHGPTVLASKTHLTLDLLGIVAFSSGIHVRLALTATGRAAERAHHETRSLSDPTDPDTQWSYLSVLLQLGPVAGEADPYLPRSGSPLKWGGVPAYRTEPNYWLGTCTRPHDIMISAGWPEIGLGPTCVTALLEASPSAVTSD